MLYLKFSATYPPWVSGTFSNHLQPSVGVGCWVRDCSGNPAATLWERGVAAESPTLRLAGDPQK